MYIRTTILALALGGSLSFSGDGKRIDSQFQLIWSSPLATVRERAAAVNRSFTNGTPIREVVAALGSNYGVLTPYSSVWIGPEPEPRKTCSLIYYVGIERVYINTTADISADPLTGRFAGAGFSGTVTPNELTNQFSIHLQDGFDGKHRVVVRVDQREIYNAVPKTSPLTGLAAFIAVTNVSAHPIVVLNIEGLSESWSNKVDLTAGRALGLEVLTNGSIRARQASRFGYD